MTGEHDAGRTAAEIAGRIVDVRSEVHSRRVRDLLSLSLFEPSPQDLDRLCSLYLRTEPPRALLAFVSGRRPLGLIGGVASPPGRCEILSLAVAPGARRRGVGRALLEACRRALEAEEVVAETDSEAVDFYRRCGFDVRPTGEIVSGVPRFRARRRGDPTETRERHVGGSSAMSGDWYTSPRITAEEARVARVELPPPGNTLPLIPARLRDEPVPAFVLEWMLETDEIGLMLQELMPDRFPPTTPGPEDRPSHVRAFLGPSTRAVATDVDRGATRGEGDIPWLPAGVDLPMEVLEVVEMGERIGAWLDKGYRVRRWAEERGYGEDLWIVPEGPDDTA